MRSRNIKPGFFINEQLAEVDFQTRLLFIGLWCFADREGRFEWIPKRIKAALFPYDDKLNIDKMLCNLMSLHFITRNDNIGYIENFAKHQHPHPHEAKSSLPQKHEQNQCHGMSLLVTKCQEDIRIEDIIIPDIRKEDTTPPLHGSFDVFYTAYPKHKAKDSAIKAWKKLNPDASLLQTILQALEVAKDTDSWKKDNGTYIPLPATWLNGKRWEDEVQTHTTTVQETQPLPTDVLKWSEYSDTIMDFHCNCIQKGKESIVDAWMSNCDYPYYKESPRTSEQWERLILEKALITPPR